MVEAAEAEKEASDRERNDSQSHMTHSFEEWKAAAEADMKEESKKKRAKRLRRQ